jgi:Tfp pilus assembly protein PilF
MVKKNSHCWAVWPLRLRLVLAILTIGAVPCAADDYPGATPPPAPSIGQSISSGFSRLTQPANPKPATVPTDDPVSLQSKATPKVEVYVAFARLFEERGDLPEAEEQYKKGLQLSPQDLHALLGYARLKDLLGQREEALKLYQKALKAHPKDASVYNDLAIHYFRLRMFRQSLAMLEHAIQLQPGDMKYRNNSATLLVEMRMPQEAFTQLLAVHDEAAAHYNLGFLMVKNGQTQQAAQQFALALQVNPSLVAARQWLDRLDGRAISMSPSAAAMIGPTQGPPNYRWQDTRLAARDAPSAAPLAPLPPSGDSNAPAAAGEPVVVVRPLGPPPSPVHVDPPPVTVRPVDTQAWRNPSAASEPTATLGSPRFSDEPSSDPPAQVAPVPPDSGR